MTVLGTFQKIRLVCTPGRVPSVATHRPTTLMTCLTNVKISEVISNVNILINQTKRWSINLLTILFNSERCKESDVLISEVLSSHFN